MANKIQRYKDRQITDEFMIDPISVEEENKRRIVHTFIGIISAKVLRGIRGHGKTKRVRKVSQNNVLTQPTLPLKTPPTTQRTYSDD